ncbi:MAG: hypothetical protein WD768_07215 [Phycisphaeraceae bacterium]
MKTLTTVAVLFFCMHAFAAEDAKPVVDVDVKGLSLTPSRAKLEPIAIPDAEALEKVFDDERVRAAILKQVDLKTHTIVYFAWSGSGQDQVLSTMVKGEEKVEVRFVYRPGRTRDLRAHHRMFAVVKGVKWEMEKNARGQ